MNPPPAISLPLRSAFGTYTRWYLRRHVHSVRLDTTGWIPDANSKDAWVVYLNHASWWDPLICLLLHHRLFPGLPAYAPMDESAIGRYAFFRKLGFFGVDQNSPRGAATFLRISRTLLNHPGTMLWLTPQGRFADARERPIELRAGLGHLAAGLSRSRNGSSLSAPNVRFVPLAIEYTYWEERLPEVLVRFGEPRTLPSGTPSPANSPADWTRNLAHRLEATMDALADSARRRATGRFQHLLDGHAGVGGTYDLWRRLRAAVRGRTFQPRHGNL